MSIDWSLVAGLGNPGAKYADTRHNLGWLVIDALASALDAEKIHEANDREPSEQWRSADALLVKPTAYVNESGSEIRRVMDYYKVSPGQLLVIADELDLPFGTVKLREGGGSAGHKGIDSVIHKVGTDGFARLRMGIGRPPEGRDAADFVLSPFSEDESADLPRIVTEATRKAKEWLDV